MDGGDTWTEVAGNGFPSAETEKGRMEIAFAPSNPHTMYAMVEARGEGMTEGFDGNGLYRSTDSEFTPSLDNLIASCLSGTTYADSEVDPFTRYSYVVRAEDDTAGHGGPCGGNEDTNQLRLSAVATGTPSEPANEDTNGGGTIP